MTRLTRLHLGGNLDGQTMYIMELVAPGVSSETMMKGKSLLSKIIMITISVIFPILQLLSVFVLPS